MNTEMIMNDEMFETALNAQISKGMTDEWMEYCEYLMNEIIAPLTTGFDQTTARIIRAFFIQKIWHAWKR